MFMKRFSPILAYCVVISCFWTLNCYDSKASEAFGIAMHGRPIFEKGFKELPYVNPEAPKGGRITFGLLGTFDTLNPYSVRGIAAQGIAAPIALVIQTLMTRSADEPFTLYAGLAKSVDIPEDRSSITFTLDADAKFSNGDLVTADDVIFTWSLLKEKGKPYHRGYYSKVVKATAPDARTVKFEFADGSDRELPLIMGLMPVLSKAATKVETFEETTQTPPIGSGPYIVAEVKAGESITVKRNPEFWGKDKPQYRGLYNADEYRFDYYRDANALFEAFKGGLYDIRLEDNPTRWVTEYNFPLIQSGKAVKDPVAVRNPKGMAALAMNTRREMFSDIRVREAMTYLFDFEWVNKSLFEGVYVRTTSFFEGSDLASTGQPASERERILLKDFPNAVRADILDGKWRPPSSDGSGRDRNNFKKALELFSQAGWTLQNGALKNAKGDAFTFETLVVSRVQERLALNYADSLKKIGITMNVRFLDDVQYWRRVGTFDFDMIQYNWAGSPSPGNEQFNRFGKAAKTREGSLNYPGVDSDAVEAMIKAMLNARERDEFVSATRALDRVLLSGFYVIPLFNAPDLWYARSANVKRPKVTPLFGFVPEALWREE